MTNKSYELSPDTDISFVSNERPTVDRIFPSLYDNIDTGMSPRLSTSSDLDILRTSFASSPFSGNKSFDIISSPYDFNYHLNDSAKSSSSQNIVRTITM